MSHTTMYAATQDQALIDRIVAAAQREAQENATLKDTERARQLREGPGNAITWFSWPVAIDYETEYAYAVDQDNPNPGGDEGVISDGNITAAIVAHWPPEPEA
jgi:hypothetical protein